MLTLPNAIVTPHIAGDAAERGLRESIFCIRQAERVAVRHKAFLCRMFLALEIFDLRFLCVLQGERVVLSVIPPGDGATPIGLDPSVGLQTGEQQVEKDMVAPTPKL